MEEQVSPKVLELLKELQDDLHLPSKYSPEQMFIILSVARTDELLSSILKAFLLHDGKPVSGDRVTLDTRLGVSRALGIITDQEYQGLYVIKGLRNDAAHKSDFSLQTKKYREKVSSLVVNKAFAEELGFSLDDPFQRIKAFQMQVTSTLRRRVRQAEKWPLRLDNWIEEVDQKWQQAVGGST